MQGNLDELPNLSNNSSTMLLWGRIWEQNPGMAAFILSPNFAPQCH